MSPLQAKHLPESYPSCAGQDSGGGRRSRIHVGRARAIAREVGNFNICINAIAPGLTLSLDDVDESGMQHYEQRAQAGCIKRVEKPEDLVGTVVFLCSPESDFITGQTIAVNGGSQMI